MSKKQRVSSIIILILIGFFIIVIPPKLTNASAPKGTVIANENVSGKDNNEIRRAIEAEIAVWQTGNDILLEGEFEQIYIPREVVQFDIEETLTQMEEKTKRSWSTFFRKKKNVQIPLAVTIHKEHEAIQSLEERNYINSEKTLLSMKEMAGQLEDRTLSITYLEGKEIPFETIATSELEIPKISNAVLNYAIEELNETVIEPNHSFSLVNSVSFPDSLKTSDDEMSFLASALYALFLQTNADIVERHAGLTVPEYAEPGLDAIVNEKEKKDLIIHYPAGPAMQLEIDRDGNVLTMTLQSTNPESIYQYGTKNMEEIKPRTLYRYSKKLRAGEEETIQTGQKGRSVEVYRTSFTEDNTYIDSELVSKDVYLPVPTIVLVSPDADVPKDDIIETDDVGEQIEEMEKTIENLESALQEETEESEERTEGNKEEEVGEQTGPINIVPIDQLEQILKEQEELEEKLATLDEKFNEYSAFIEEDMEEKFADLDKRFTQLKEQYEEILDLILNGEPLEGEAERKDD